MFIPHAVLPVNGSATEVGTFVCLVIVLNLYLFEAKEVGSLFHLSYLYLTITCLFTMLLTNRPI